MTVTSTRLQATAILTATLVVGAFAAPAVAGVMQDNTRSFIHERIGNKSTYDSVAKLLISTGDAPNADPQFSIASGVLVGGRYLVTAAHNVDSANAIEAEINGRSYRGTRWVMHKNAYNYDFTPVNRNPLDEDYNPFPTLIGRGMENGHDIAIIELDRRVVNARNVKAKMIRNSNNATNKTGTIVGFGAVTNADQAAGTPIFDGLKRGGYNKIGKAGISIGNQLVTDLDADPSRLQDIGTFTTIPRSIFNPFTNQYTIDEDDIPIEGEYQPAIGDSGAGLFVNGNTLAGIASWTSRTGSGYFSKAYYTPIATHYAWIQQNIRALRGRGPFRQNLKLWTQIDVEKTVPDPDDPMMTIDITVPRFIKVSDWGATNSTSFLAWGDLGTDGDIGYPGYAEGLGFTVGIDFTDLGRNEQLLPEPTSLALLSLGGLAMIRRTRD